MFGFTLDICNFVLWLMERLFDNNPLIDGFFGFFILAVIFKIFGMLVGYNKC